ncbi:Glutaminyl-peptide cyclotransferase [Cytospora mali]|uniref:Peptide hydrolase n=1 Tax=Cytospora mali TaxID=578113 RepID=A0A194UPM3_CYTMA|nr:Glutaminyl-peptide cyclotransferase [Valsa mali var. pyri (nom. inval.)]
MKPSPGSGHVPSLLAIFLLFLTVAAYSPLSDSFLRAVPSPGDDFNINNGALLAPILIPRVPGTPGSAKVQQHFVDFFQKELPRWEVEWQNSTARTPATGSRDVPFNNIVFKREPPWTKPGQANILTLVAHFDSKLTPEGFIGATDSAVPCAVLMHVARSIDQYLTQMYDEMVDLGELGGTPAMDMGVQILLLDGEEAFVSWTDTDSLYGARSLAESWENEPTLAMANFPNRLNQISLFVLLDLLGSADPQIPSYFLPTHWSYQAMANVEQRMRDLGLLESQPSRPFLSDSGKLASQFRRSWVGDDHVPFMARGVPVLHLIPSPFPTVWHSIEDDGEHLDMPTVRDWAKIMTAFALEWLDMMEVWPQDQ